MTKVYYDRYYFLKKLEVSILENKPTQIKTKSRNKIINFIKPVITKFPDEGLSEEDKKFITSWYDVDKEYFVTNRFPEEKIDDGKIVDVIYFFIRNKNHNDGILENKLKLKIPFIGDDYRGKIFYLLSNIVPERCSCNSGKYLRYKNYEDGFKKSCSMRCSHTEILKMETNKKLYGTEHVGQVDEFIRKRENTCLEKYGEKNYMQTTEGKNKNSESYFEKTGYKNPLSNPDIKDKIKKTNNERYGGNSPMCNDLIKEKSKNICLEKYDTEYGFQSEIIKNKIKNTNNERYGVDYIGQSDSIKNKIKETNNERYGSDCVFGNKEIKRKAENTIEEVYGFKHAIQNKDVREKASDTYKKRTGYRNPLSNPEVRNKIDNEYQQTYGVSHISQIHIGKENIDNLNNKQWLEEQLNSKTAYQIATEIGCDESHIYKKCASHEITFFKNRSNAENIIENFIKDYIQDYRINNRDIIFPLELDIFLPEYNLAIEYNGLYWHSDIFKKADYHLNKYLSCKEKDIRLISINEDEWDKNSNIIKSKILNLIGKSKNGTPARKSHINEITSNEANEFCEKYHIQGKTSSIIYAIGAYDEFNILIGIMAFSKQRTTGDIELIRFCHDGLIHNGLFSKMLKYSIKNNNWNKIISFADLRYSDGNLYLKNGFTEECVIKPDYRYVKNKNTYHKSNFKKSSIMKKFNLSEDYVNSKTEKELMEEQGYCRIYDIGKIKYVMEIK